jgi:hypothetical protein
MSASRSLKRAEAVSPTPARVTRANADPHRNCTYHEVPRRASWQYGNRRMEVFLS